MLGVITNCFIMNFTTDAFASANGLSITQRIWAAFIAEHALFIVKFGLAYLIPDTPAYIVREVAKKEWIRDCQVQALTASSDTDLSSALDASRAARSEQRMHAASGRIVVAEEFEDEVD